MLRRVVFAVVVLAAGAGLAGQASGQQTVTAGAFCSPQGATGVTSTGIPMTCVSEGGAQARWRATSDLPATTTTAQATTTTVDGTGGSTSNSGAASNASATTTTTVASAASATPTTIRTAAPATPQAPLPIALTG